MTATNLASKIAPLTSAIATSLLLSACGASDGNDDKTVSYQATATMGAITAGVGSYTVKVTASDGESLEGQTISVLPIMDMASMEGTRDHSTPTSKTEGELDENGEFTATGYFLMQSGAMGSWSLEVSAEGITQTVPVTVNWDTGGPVTLYGSEQDQIMSMSGGMVKRPYYIFNPSVISSEQMNMTVVVLYVSARETMMDYNAVSTGETLTGGAQDLGLSEVSLEVCASDCMDADSGTMNTANWQEALGSHGAYEVTFMATDIDTLMLKLTVNGEVKTTNSGAMHTSLSLSASSTDMGQNHAM